MKILLEEIYTELDSFDIFSIFKDKKDVFFLDSVRDFNDFGRYSFIGLHPFKRIRELNGKCEVDGDLFDCSIFDKLEEILNIYMVENTTEIPFIGGCIGYVSYDIGLEMEELKTTAKDDFVIPNYYYLFFDNLLIFDNKYNRKYISACGMLRDNTESIALIKELISRQEKVEAVPKNNISAQLTANFTKDEYIGAVSKVRDYIKSGDVYIANLTQRFSAKTDKSAYEIYSDLRRINPAPFAAYIGGNGFDIISSSPERFLKITNRKVETRPIKGTRPRGRNRQEDMYFREELVNSEKDKAELLMIVDLERNDLSKVCRPNTVKVTELFKLEEYSTVFHLVATVTGELKERESAVSCLKACFPGGSITGTPKIRAMEIIDELEGIKRGVYTGCIGYFSFDGNADFNIAIRTIVKKDNKVCFGVGGGITWDSIEEQEYRETLDKAKALIEVI